MPYRHLTCLLWCSMHCFKGFRQSTSDIYGSAWRGVQSMVLPTSGGSPCKAAGSLQVCKQGMAIAKFDV